MIIGRTDVAADAAADGDGDDDADADGCQRVARRMSPLANQRRLDDIPLAPLATLTRLPLPR